jgi:Ca-activated chloride channel family protein
MKTDDKDLKTLAKAIAPSHITQERESNEAMLQKRMDQGYWIVLLVLPLVLLLFRRGILLAVVLLFMPHTAQAFSWDQWWETPDQKGERLFHEENYSEAREQFQNDDWQGAASYRMGDYNDSAQSFKQNQTAEGLYNYGTAKAKSGDLEEALEAYQRTLELDPTHEDALYNKELIEELKKEQEKQEQSQEGEKQQESESQEQKSKEKNNSQQEQQQDSNKEQTEDQQEQKGGSKPNDEETSEEERSSNQSNQQSDDRDEVQEEHKHSDLDPKEERELNEQFQSEMEQELEKREEQSQEPSEQATEEMEDVEALQRKIDDKWLDKVEDDPGGLLRRKFLLQYRQKKR